MPYLDDRQLEQSSVVANCCMNRQRDLCGSNGYDVEIDFKPMEFLLAQVTKHGKARWLDLCCGTGNALAQASNIVDAENLSIKIVGVDLVGMFVAHESKSLTLIEASLSTWQPTEMFDLITCIHGLHYIGDKLTLITRACSWLTLDGLFVASLDTANLRLHPTGVSSPRFAKELRQVGVEYSPKKHLVRCVGTKSVQLPFTYVGANDQAGPNYTKQAVVHSYYSVA
jgi:predicted TPR repeat methyltransferase